MAGPRLSSATTDGVPTHGRILIVEARYYGAIADALLEGARRVLDAAGVEWDIVSVTGSLEVPQAVAIALEAPVHTRRLPFDGIVALGCVIRGETTHYEAVAGECASGIQAAQLETGVPIAFGALTVENLDQALARSEGPGGHNVGEDGAKVAVEMARLLGQIRSGA